MVGDAPSSCRTFSSAELVVYLVFFSFSVPRHGFAEPQLEWSLRDPELWVLAQPRASACSFCLDVLVFDAFRFGCT